MRYPLPFLQGLFARRPPTGALIQKRTQQEILRRRASIEPLEARIAPAGVTVMKSVTVEGHGTGPASPGDTLHYTIVIQAEQGFTGVTLSDILDTNTTFVEGSMHASPLAFNDVYATAGNTQLAVGLLSAPGTAHVTAAEKLTDNDVALTDTFSVVSGTFSTFGGGSVDIGADGSFLYTPMAGFSGTDVFTYTLENATNSTLADMGSVAISVGSQHVWYLDSSAPINGDGTSASPFNSTASFVNSRPDAAGDIIYLSSGHYGDGLTLLNNESLIGAGTALQVSIPPIFSNPTLLLAAGTAPTIDGGVILSTDNTLSGFIAGDATNGTGPAGTVNSANNGFAISGTSFGVLTVDNVAIANSIGGALQLDSGIVLGSGFTSTTGHSVALAYTGGTLHLGTGALDSHGTNTFSVTSGDAKIDYVGTITAGASANASSVDIQNTYGTVTLSGQVTDNSLGINLSHNTYDGIQGKIVFSGGVNSNTTTTPAFHAAEGGIVEVTGAGNILFSSESMALSVSDTEIGPAGLTFQSISAGHVPDPSSSIRPGIYLESTGTDGGLTVTGKDGVDGSGGTIQYIGGDSDGFGNGAGIYLHYTAHVSLAYMHLHDFQNSGIYGENVDGLLLDHITIDGENSYGFGTSAIELHNLTGRSGIQHSDISGATASNVVIVNDSVYDPLDLTILDNKIHGTGVEGGLHNLLIGAIGDSTITALVKENTFGNTDGVQIEGVVTESGILNITVDSNILKGDAGATNFLSGIYLHSFGSSDFPIDGTLNFTISNNTISNDTVSNTMFDSITVEMGEYSAIGHVLSGSITGNTIGTAGQDASGSAYGNGIAVITAGNGTSTILIDDNKLINTDHSGIHVEARDASQLAIAITNNDFVNEFHSGSGPGLSVVSGGQSQAFSQSPPSPQTISLEITGNHLQGSAQNLSWTDFSILETNLSTIQIPGYIGVNSDNVAVVSYIQSLSATGDVPTGEAFNTDPSGGGFIDTPGSSSVPAPAPTPLPQTPQPLVFAPTPAAPVHSTDDAAGTVQPSSGTTPALASGHLSQYDLDLLVGAAIERWEATGLTPAQSALLHDVTFSVSNLGALTLGQALPGHITLDDNAAGLGWFIDTTPLDDSEFAPGSTVAAGHVDALTAIMHELGHELGLDDTYQSSRSSDVMYGQLSLGSRHLPTLHEAVGATPHTGSSPDLLLGPLSIGTLLPGKSVKVLFDATVNTGQLTGVTSITNQATLTADGGITVDSNTTNVALSASPDLVILSYVDGVSEIQPGGLVDYHISYRNSGNVDATDVFLTQQLPDNATFHAGSNPANWVEFSPGSGTYQLYLGDLAVGDTGDVYFAYDVANPSPAGTQSVISTVSIYGNESEINSANNTVSDSNTLIAYSDLALTLSDGGATGLPGGTIVYTLNYANSGNLDSSGAFITETLPAHTTFNDSLSDLGWQQVDATHYRFSIETGLAGGGGNGSVAFAVTIEDPLLGSPSGIVNQAIISDSGANGPDPTPTNNEASATTSLGAVIQFSQEGYVIGEDGVASGSEITITRSGSISGSSDVTVTLPGTGTATAGVDYDASSFHVLFAAGETSKTIVIPITNDRLVEGDESFGISLSVKGGDSLGSLSSTSVQIADNDYASFSILETVFSESGGHQNLSVQLDIISDGTGPIALAHALSLDVSDSGTGSATSGVDYAQFNPVTLTFAAGSGDATIQLADVNILPDTLIEGSEIIHFQLGNLSDDLSAHATIAVSQSIGAIGDDDTAKFSISPTYTFSEGGGIQDVTITLVTSPGATFASTYMFSLTDLGGTATAGDDYTAIGSQWITVEQGTGNGATYTTHIEVLNDRLVEGPEYLQLIIPAPESTVDGQVTFGNTHSTVTITDNDTASFSLLPSTFDESAGSQDVAVQMHITADGTGLIGLAHEVTLDLVDAGTGTAASGLDYTAFGTHTVTFGSSFEAAQTQYASIGILGDTLIEGNETIHFHLQNLSNSLGGAVGIETADATSVIVDDDSATFSIATTHTFGEAGGIQDIVVTLHTSPGATFAAPYTLNLSDLGGTASAGSDYTAFEGTSIIFGAGAGDNATSAAHIAVLNDRSVEGSEDFSVHLQTASTTLDGQVTFGNTDSVVTITDNDTASFAIQSGSVTESGGTQAVDVKLIITSDGTGPVLLSRQLTLDIVESSGGSATAGDDYTAFGTKTVTFEAGALDGSTASAPLDILGDTLIEGNETVHFHLQNLSASLDGAASISGSDSVTTIADDDTAHFSIGTAYSFNEGGESQRLVTVTLETSPGATFASSYTLNLTDLGTGSATADSDYTAFGSQSIVFEAGAGNGATNSTTIYVYNDRLVEGSETLNLQLQNLGSNLDGVVTLGNTDSVVTILDIDSATFTLQQPSFTELATQQSVNVALSITADGSGPIALGHALSLDLVDAGTGTATSGSDYSALGTKTITFNEGSTDGDIASAQISIHQDTLVEGNETFHLHLQNLSATLDGHASVAVADTIGTIVDNDTATLSIAPSFNTSEAAIGKVTVTLITDDGFGGTATLAPGVTLQADIIDLGTGSAVSGTDYEAFGTQTVSFGPGSGNGDVRSGSLTGINDTIVQGSRDVNFHLENLSTTLDGLVSLDGVDGTGTILDNDTATLSFTHALYESGENTISQVGVNLLITANGVAGVGTLGKTVSVSVQDLLTGSATPGVDYALSSDSIASFEIGDSSSTKTLNVHGIDDTLVEGSETINFHLAGLDDGTGGQVTLSPLDTTLVLKDNDINLQVTQHTSSTSVIAGSGPGNLIVTLTVENLGVTDATGVMLIEDLNLPFGVYIDSVQSSGNGFYNTHSGLWTVGNIAGQSSETLTFTLTASSFASDGLDNITGHAIVSRSTQTLAFPEDDVASFAVSVGRQVDLHVTAGSQPAPTQPGQTTVFELHYGNSGTSDTFGATLTETLPVGTTFNANASTAGWTETFQGSHVYTLDLSYVGAGAEGIAAFAVTANQPAFATSGGTPHEGADILVNRFSIAPSATDLTPDSNPGNNSGSQTIALDAAPDLHVTVANPDLLQLGADAAYTITYQNGGTQDATGVVITQALPAHTTYSSAGSSVAWSETSAGSGVYTTTIGNVAASGAAANVTFGFTVDSTVPAGFIGLSATTSIADNGENGADLQIADNSATTVSSLYKGIYATSPDLAAGSTALPQVQVYDVATGNQLYSFSPYDDTYHGGVRVAIGDMNGDGFADIITTTVSGKGALRVFDGLTGLQLQTGPWAQELNPFNGTKEKGASVAIGDVDGDGHNDLIVGSALKGGVVKVYNGLTGSLLTTYHPFGGAFKSGVNVASGDLNGDGMDDVIVGQAAKGANVKAYSGATNAVLQSFHMGAKPYKGGITVAAGDLDGDGKADIITGTIAKLAAQIQVYSGLTHAAIGGPITPFGSNFKYDVRVAVTDINADGIADIIASSGRNPGAAVHIYNGVDEMEFTPRSFIPYTDPTITGTYIA